MYDKISESIKKTKQGFEESFAAETFYNSQTQDEKHLELILSSLEVKTGMKILDLGTGTGYLAVPFAESYPETEITGLDIVEKALCRNRQKADQKGIKNLQFVCYNGMEFPFDNNEFDLIISRYALHYFPEVSETFQEISRVLKPAGQFFLSDPTPNENDTNRFGI